MKIAFAILIALHGLIHLLAPAKAFGWANVTQLRQPIAPSSGVLWLLTAVLLIGLSVGLTFWKFSHERSLVEQWAKKNEYSIVNREKRSVVTGPFMWSSSRNQTIYYVTIADKTGLQRNAWVRCGGYYLGPLSDQIDVRWTDGQ